MPLSSEQILKLELTINGVKECADDPSSGVTEWEFNFMIDQEERYQQYGDNMRISDKQWAIIDRIYDKVA